MSHAIATIKSKIKFYQFYRKEYGKYCDILLLTGLIGIVIMSIFALTLYKVIESSTFQSIGIGFCTVISITYSIAGTLRVIDEHEKKIASRNDNHES